MLKELRELLPDFQITKNGILYDFKRTTIQGNVIHIPAILTKSSTPTTVAASIKEAWGRLCLR